MGTPAFMAPEQALGRTAEISSRTDVYSLGAILYEILTLEPPFTGETPLAILIKVTSWSLVPPRQRAPQAEIPEELEEICLRALARNPDDRHPSANEMRRDIEAFLEGARARQAADEQVARGAIEVERYARARSQAAELVARAREASKEVRSFDPVERKRPLWDLERAARHAETEVAHAFAQAAGAFEHALVFVPNHPRRADPAKLYFARFEQAEAQRDVAAVYFRTQIESLRRRIARGPPARRSEAVGRIRSHGRRGHCVPLRRRRGSHCVRTHRHASADAAGGSVAAARQLSPDRRAEGRVETRCPYAWAGRKRDRPRTPRSRSARSKMAWSTSRPGRSCSAVIAMQRSTRASSSKRGLPHRALSRDAAPVPESSSTSRG